MVQVTRTVDEVIEDIRIRQPWLRAGDHELMRAEILALRVQVDAWFARYQERVTELDAIRADLARLAAEVERQSGEIAELRLRQLPTKNLNKDDPW